MGDKALFIGCDAAGGRKTLPVCFRALKAGANIESRHVQTTILL
jgi:hypothetical protein